MSCAEVCVYDRSQLSVVVVALVLLVTGAACGGNSDTRSTAMTSGLVMETLTPRSAFATPTVTPQGPRESTPTAGPNEIRPPEMVLVTPAGQSIGIVAANAWHDPETDTFSGFEFAGRVILAIDPIEWPSDSEATFDLLDSPYPPGTTRIAIYAYEENIATPTNSQGQVMGTDPAFVKQTDPVAELDLHGEPLTLSAPVPSGKYIVDVTIHWPVPPDIAERLPEEAMTQYVFVVVVPSPLPEGHLPRHRQTFNQAVRQLTIPYLSPIATASASVAKRSRVRPVASSIWSRLRDSSRRRASVRDSRR